MPDTPLIISSDCPPFSPCRLTPPLLRPPLFFSRFAQRRQRRCLIIITPADAPPLLKRRFDAAFAVFRFRCAAFQLPLAHGFRASALAFFASQALRQSH